MTTHSLTGTHPADTTSAPPSRRATSAIGLLTMAVFISAVLVAPKQDVTTATQLHAFLEENGLLQAVAWLLTLAWGLTWLLFVVGLRRLLPGKPRPRPVHGRGGRRAGGNVGRGLDEHRDRPVRGLRRDTAGV